MKFNLTINDNLAETLNNYAVAQNTTPLELIREAIIDRYGCGLPISQTKFYLLKPKEMSGYLKLIGNSRFFFCVKKNGPDEILQFIREVPLGLEDLFEYLESSYFKFPSKKMSGTFSAIKLPVTENPILLLNGNICLNTPNMDSIHELNHSKNIFRVSQRFISEFFDLAIVND